ncbi:MAG: tetratricopeptide repeat protein [Planctomycetota bacterium]|nr:tetratricopeptide repeat protein [Planctomycetota bacterium]
MSEELQTPSPWVVNTTPDTFEQDVFERSREALVIVDFWAAWCAPCRALAPILEALATELDGKFILVKANTEEVPEAAAKFNVQGIPAVYAVIDGEVVDFFTGALPEAQIRGWLDQLFTISTFVEAKRFEESAPETAEAKYRSLAEQAPDNAEFQIGLARTLLAQQRFDDCQHVISELEKRGFLEPEAEKVKAALDLRSMEGVDLDSLKQAAAAEPGNLGLQLQLAEALAGAHQYEAALQACLAIVEQDRKGVGDAARQVMIDIFRVLRNDSELTTEYQRKLSTALY